MRKKIVNFFETTSDFFGIDVTYFVGNFSWMSIGQGLSALFSFILALAFARFLSKEIFGQYTYVQSIFQLFGVFGLSSMGVAVTRAVAKKRFDTLTSAVLLTLIASTFGALLMGLLVTTVIDTVVRKPLLLLVLLFPFYHAFSLYSPFLQGKKEFRRDNLLFLIPATLTPLLLILALSLGVKSVLALLVISYFPEIVFRILYTLLITKENHSSFLPPLLTDDTRYGLKLSLTDIPTTIGFHLDKVLIGALLSREDLAIFAFAIASPELIKNLLKSIGTLAIPKLTEQRIEDYKRKIGHHLAILEVVLLLIITCYVLVAPTFFQIFFPSYTDSVFYSQIFSLSLITFPSILFTSFFQAHGLTNQIFKINLVYLISQAGMLFLLIPTFGVMGAIVSRMISRLLVGMYTYRLLKAL